MIASSLKGHRPHIYTDTCLDKNDTAYLTEILDLERLDLPMIVPE